MFLWFLECRVDICIVEVGLGGALDATNVLEQPLACVFTSIGIDHEAILGNSLEEIATHKAGILKKYGNAVISHQNETSAFQSLVYQCKNNKVNYVCSGVAQIKESVDHSSKHMLVEYTTKTLMTTYEVECPLQGDFQLINLACALDVIDLLKANHKDLFLIPTTAVSLGCSKTTWPGRLEWVEATGLGRILVDGAHNPAAAQALSDYLGNFIATQLSHVEGSFHVHWIFGATKGKCIDKIIPILLKSLADGLNPKQGRIKSDISLVGFSQPDEMPWICSWPTDILHSKLLELPDVHFDKIQQFSTISDALETLKVEHPNLPDNHHLVVVTGSLYLVADLFRFLDPAKAHIH
ncbi:folylpolyglutamate synthase [Entomophthora muscae]|uniref:Folylpolyglutamate synthase n=1 Tax=Entomophthora muscae TaxID=34485 RepID=A0ACC2SST5_9FUNG|nr:folylpolyglutamate synthase [Entomophthora muscae]